MGISAEDSGYRHLTPLESRLMGLGNQVLGWGGCMHVSVVPEAVSSPPTVVLSSFLNNRISSAQNRVQHTPSLPAQLAAKCVPVAKFCLVG